jgi:hypothetical protein
MKSPPSVLPYAYVATRPDTRRAPIELRYDDVTQHGHIKQTALPLVLGRVCFGELWARHPLFATRKQRIVTVLTRLVLEAEPIAVSLSAEVDGHGRIELAHERGADGAVRALFLNAHGEMWAVPSRRNPAHANGPRPRVLVGRAYGEHVFTRPLAPAHERKVLQFDVPGEPSVPGAPYQRELVAMTARLPANAEPLDPELTPDAAPWVFGLLHTDHNQHVNSLVYARACEEAALRRCALHDRNLGLHAARLELNYRKPCFAGESLVCMLQSYLVSGQPGVIGYLGPVGCTPERAHMSFRLQFRHVPS